MNKLIIVLRLIRVHQWIKNLFVLIGPFFGLNLFKGSNLITIFYAFLAFCFCSSAVYIINDYIDRESDKLHSEKSKRPLASGQILVYEAFILLSLLLILSLFLSFLIASYTFTALLVLYFCNNILYSVKLKQYALIDILLLSSGFLIRVLAGCYITDTMPSKWLVMMIFLLSVFLALGKRNDDLHIFHNTGVLLRKSLNGYNQGFLNISLTFTSTIMFVTYIMYTVSPEVTTRMKTENVYYSCLWVFIGLLRYFQIVYVFKQSGGPSEILLKDKFLFFVVAGWIATFIWILYLS